ncbi:prolyl 4-hydroxylase, alpha subunit [Canna indica]|uniref:procollagen-proline 4-dioxygenase n=1 Tax=Canna indica TaxID=4628 RepID=A0AAQ3QL15_9LILI|nr:prolyl 4-hydroxylase, alpha subunit [Canna indica]
MAASSKRSAGRAERSSTRNLHDRKAFSSLYALGLLLLLVLSFLLVLLLAFRIYTLPVSSDSVAETEALPLFNPRQPAPARSSDDVEGPEKRGQQWTEVLSWKPRAFIHHNFLSKEECEHLIEKAKPRMKKSTVLDPKTGERLESKIRTSSGAFLRRGEDEIIMAIEKRIAQYTFIPAEHGEGFQVLHYEIGQMYVPHHDYFFDEYSTENKGQRVATLLMYLSDVEEGGETFFPHAEVNSTSLPWHNELSQCGKIGLGVKPKMGDALLFYNMKPDATMDPQSLHGGCPVIRGNKWSATKWLHLQEWVSQTMIV